MLPQTTETNMQKEGSLIVYIVQENNIQFLVVAIEETVTTFAQMLHVKTKIKKMHRKKLLTGSMMQ